MDQQSWISLLVSWLPFIALIVVWVVLSRGMQTRGPWAKTANLYEEQLVEVRRTNALLERIATALESRVGK
jgi:ATP-dependent Zn protease